MLPVGSTTIERVRLKQVDVDAPLARQRLSFLFSSAVLQPARMPPSAVLVIRSMYDPLPGRIAPKLATATMLSTEWEHAAQSQLGDIYRKAARPSMGPVPLSAEAVLFADYGELLACLALDFSASEASSWWWKSTLRHHSTLLTSAWLQAWAENPRYVPSALQQLDERGQAAQVLRKMTPAEAWRLLLAVARAFDLPESAFGADARESVPYLTRGINQQESPAFGGRSGVNANSFADAAVGAQGKEDSASHFTKLPWEPYVSASSTPAELGPERRALIGVSLLLSYSPQQAASAVFAHELRSWLAFEHTHDAASSDEQAPQIDPRQLSIDRKPSDETNSASAIQFNLSSDRESEDLQTPETFDAGSLRDGLNQRASSSLFDTAAQNPILNAVSAALPMSEIALQQADTSNSDARAGKSSQPWRLHLENGCRTGLGGLFYLTHLLRRAYLPYFDVDLGGWALLELLARCVLPPGSADLHDDPVWTALALLDRREPGTSTGAAFRSQSVYEAPDVWLRNLEATERMVRFRSDGVELWHPEGFLTFDSQEQPLIWPQGFQLTQMNRQKRRGLRRYASVCPMQLNLSPELRRFLHFILPYARWRMSQALGEASLQEILQREGTLYVTRSHVDLVMSMKQVSLPARFAGIDANPGWVPELGRVITFHFVQEGF